jgi:hypothetical protein
MYVVRSKSGRVLRRCLTRRDAEAFIAQQKSPDPDPEIVSSRMTHDDVRVHLHKDGSVSTRSHFFRVRLPVSVMWRAWEDVSLYDYNELSAFIKQVKKLGTWPPKRRPTNAESEAILAGQKRTMWFNPQTGILTYAPGFLPSERKRRQ